jgi:hypothetical protein
MKKRLTILLAAALVSVSGATACGGVQEELEKRAQEEVEKGRRQVEQKVQEKVQEERTKIEKQVQEKVQEGRQRVEEEVKKGQQQVDQNEQ